MPIFIISIKHPKLNVLEKQGSWNMEDLERKTQNCFYLKIWLWTYKTQKSTDELQELEVGLAIFLLKNIYKAVVFLYINNKYFKI